MDEQILKTFNKPQLDAINYCDGASLVIAGAGSGKTRVLTYKIAYLLEQGYEPWSILALTFTNKAANEMKSRIARIVGVEKARYLWMGTFHSVFLRILRTEHERIDFSSNFTIYDASDSKSLVKSIIKEMKLDDKTYKPSSVLDRICAAKNQLIDPETYYSSPGLYQHDVHSKMPAVRDIYTRYWNRCKQSDAMDFDDILMYTYKLFAHNPDILEKYESRFAYVLVDEYQDTNFAQHQIVLQLTKRRQKVCVVGDDAQSIYSFRGANIDNILTFKELFKNTKVFKLEQNYRSTQMIVDAANSLIHKNTAQIYKNVFSEKEVGDKLPIIEAYSDVEEAQIVVKKISELRSREHIEYSDFAILYRTNAQSRLFEEHLRKNGLPYRIYGGLSFYQRKEIKDIIAYYRVSVNPHDEEALKRIINYPARGIGNTTVSKIVDVANLNNTSLWNVISNPQENHLPLNAGTMKKINEFVQLINRFRDKVANENAQEAGEYIVKECGIIADIYSDASPENLSRQENVEELMNGLQDFCSSRLEEGNNNVSVSDYLAEISLLSDVDSDKDDDGAKVTLMTIHSAKGLEFDTVFVVGLEENLFPSQMSGTSPREIEEERRLFYVAITRAQHHCFITYAKSRFHFGKMEFSNPSRFLRDIDPQFVVFRSNNGMNNYNGFGNRGGRDVELPWNRQQRPSLFTPHEQSARQDSYTNRSSSYSERTSSYSSGQSSYRSQRVQPVSPPSGFRRVSTSRPTSSSTPVQPTQSAPTTIGAGLHAGQHIQHERFGYGEILKMEGSGDSLKATVQFQNAGTKQLLIKFARFKVLD